MFLEQNNMRYFICSCFLAPRVHTWSGVELCLQELNVVCSPRPVQLY